MIVIEANEDDNMEVDDDQELVIIPVRDKGKDECTLIIPVTCNHVFLSL